MPSIEDNLKTWNQYYDWPEGGHEWSSFWGGTDVLWGGSLSPRIRSFLPTSSLLEIAPGFGRITSYLVERCEKYIGVDLAEKCVTECRSKFSAFEHAAFFVTDGYSLNDVPDKSVDFAFSFDSLVHVEADVMQAYARELARTLKPGGRAFLHHSNVGAFLDSSTGEITISNDHWRGTTMSAQLMREFAASSGIHCAVQEIINWGGTDLSDCFSLLVAQSPSDADETLVVENPRFMDQAVALGQAAEVFARASK